MGAATHANHLDMNTIFLTSILQEPSMLTEMLAVQVHCTGANRFHVCCAP